MSAVRPLSALAVLAAIGLTACGQPASSPPTEGGAQPAPEPVVLTDEQKTALLEELPEPYRSADLERGERLYAMCRSCHTYVPGGANLTGPNLWGTFDAKAGHVAGYNYSDALKASGLVWDAATMDKWIENPRGLVAGTKMAYVGMKSAEDRAALVAWLKVNSSAPK